MGQVDFHYGYGTEIADSGIGGGMRDGADDPAGAALAVTIYADRVHLRGTMCDGTILMRDPLLDRGMGANLLDLFDTDQFCSIRFP